VTGVVEVEGITPGGDETPCRRERYFSYSLVIFFLSNIFLFRRFGLVMEGMYVGDLLLFVMLNISNVSYRCSAE
jgi:hypothetical protein